MRYNNPGEAFYLLTAYVEDTENKDLIDALEYLFDEYEVDFDQLPEGLRELFKQKKRLREIFQHEKF